MSCTRASSQTACLRKRNKVTAGADVLVVETSSSGDLKGNTRKRDGERNFEWIHVKRRHESLLRKQHSVDRSSFAPILSSSLTHSLSQSLHSDILGFVVRHLSFFDQKRTRAKILEDCFPHVLESMWRLWFKLRVSSTDYFFIFFLRCFNIFPVSSIFTLCLLTGS